MKKNNIYDSPLISSWINQKGTMVYEDTSGNEVECIGNHNRYGFRSDEFTATHDDKRHLLFAGCSETYGRGGNIEESWGHMVYSSISKNTDTSGFFNLGIPGAGFKEIICEVIEYCNKYGAPDDIFILFPNLERYIWYINSFDNKDDNGYYGVAIDNNNFGRLTGLDSKTPEERKSSYPNDKEELANFIIMMKIFEQYCISSGINLFWSTWDTDNLFGKELKDNLHGLKFFTNLNLNLEKVKDHIDNKGMSLVKPDGHSGSAIHLEWANKFMEIYKGRLR
jgi:hypothetical protein